MSQTCATCEYGKDQRCYWPCMADGDGETWDALFDPMPPWLESEIDNAMGKRVNDRFDCSRCPCFSEREPPKPESERCPNTADLFRPSASEKAAEVLAQSDGTSTTRSTPEEDNAAG